MLTNYSYTEKNALQYDNSYNPLVDFFRSAAAQRSAVLNNKDNILNLFANAYEVDKSVAFKLAFWLRDPRNGSGEKAASKKIFDVMYLTDPNCIIDNLDVLVKFGYWKDILQYSDNESVIKIWADKIKSGDSLSAKWAPRLHSKYHSVAIKLRDELKLTNKQYRLILKETSNTVEQLMAKNYWKDIKYSSVPSIAMNRYKKSFNKHDQYRFDAWKNNNNEKANSRVLYPHQIVKIALTGDEKLAEKLWNNLPDFIKENESIIPLVDTSGSMTSHGVLLHAVSLGIYLSERNKSHYKDKIITFSSVPNFINVGGCNTLVQKIKKISSANWNQSTDFEKAYNLILQTAIKHNIDKEFLPTMLLVLSDMQFDESSDKVLHIDNIKKMFNDAGYNMPKLVFWNLREAYNGSPALSTDSNVGLVSGFSPSIMKAVLSSTEFNSLDILFEAIKEYSEVKTDNLPDFYNVNQTIQKLNYQNFYNFKTRLTNLEY